MKKEDRHIINILGIEHPEPQKVWRHYKTGKVILNLIERYHIETFVEVGSLGSYLSELVCKVYPNVRVSAIDLVFKRPEVEVQYDNLSFFVGDSTEMAGRFDAVDLVYIDGDHTYDKVTRDLEAWYPKTRKIFAGHDYNYHEPNEPLKPWKDECTRAIDQFMEKHELTLNLADYYNWFVVKNAE